MGSSLEANQDELIERKIRKGRSSPIVVINSKGVFYLGFGRHRDYPVFL